MNAPRKNGYAVILLPVNRARSDPAAKAGARQLLNASRYNLNPVYAGNARALLPEAGPVIMDRYPMVFVAKLLQNVNRD